MSETRNNSVNKSVCVFVCVFISNRMQWVHIIHFKQLSHRFYCQISKSVSKKNKMKKKMRMRWYRDWSHHGYDSLQKRVNDERRKINSWTWLLSWGDFLGIFRHIVGECVLFHRGRERTNFIRLFRSLHSFGTVTHRWWEHRVPERVG